MKRAALLRHTPLRSKPPVWVKPERQRAALLAPPPGLFRNPAPVEDAPVHVPKGDFDKLAAYRAWVKTFPCFGCGAAPPSVCCHANEGKGQGLKVSDRRTFPLCVTCHEALDNSRGMTREERRQKERRYVDRMQELARAARRPEFPPP